MAVNPKLLKEALIALLRKFGKADPRTKNLEQPDLFDPSLNVPRQRAEKAIPEGEYIEGQLDELATNPQVQGTVKATLRNERRQKERAAEQDAAAIINPLETTMEGQYGKPVQKFVADETTPTRSDYRKPLREDRPRQQTVDEKVTQDIEEMLNELRSDPHTTYDPALLEEAAGDIARSGLNQAEVNDRAKFLFELLGDKADYKRPANHPKFQMGLSTALRDVGKPRKGQTDEMVLAERLQLRESKRKLMMVRREAQAVAARARETGDTKELDAMIDRLLAPSKGTQGDFNLGDPSPSRVAAPVEVDEAAPIATSNVTRKQEAARQSQEIIDEILEPDILQRSGGGEFDPTQFSRFGTTKGHEETFAQMQFLKAREAAQNLTKQDKAGQAMRDALIARFKGASR